MSGIITQMIKKEGNSIIIANRTYTNTNKIGLICISEQHVFFGEKKKKAIPSNIISNDSDRESTETLGKIAPGINSCLKKKQTKPLCCYSEFI